MKFLNSILVWLGFSPTVEAPVLPSKEADRFDHPPQAGELDFGRPLASNNPLDSSMPEENSIVPENAWWRCTEDTIVEWPRLRLDDEADQCLFKEVLTFVEDPNIELPHLPHIPQRILTLLRQPNINYPGLGKVLSQDQTLSANVLRIANSAAYAGIEQITNLEVALSRLGMKSIQGLMLKESVKSITIKKTSHGQSTAEILWKKSVASAVIMERLASPFDLRADDAFIAGLLHDIGEMVLLRLIHDYQKITKQKLPAQVVQYIFQECHQTLGGTLAEHWNLPDSIKPLLRQHHGQIPDDDPHHACKRLLQVTDMLNSLMGLGEKHPFDLLGTQSARLLGLGSDPKHFEALDELPDLVKAELNRPL